MLKKTVLSFFAFASCTLFADVPQENLKSYSVQKTDKAEGDKWPSYLQVEGKTGNFRDLARLVWLWPLWQDNDSMLFADIRVMLDNKGDREGNLGLAFRKILRQKGDPEDGIILGAYAFYDRKRSVYKNWFNQATFGVEALGEYFRAGGNYYLPQDKSFHIGNSYNLSASQSSLGSHGNNLMLSYDTVVNTYSYSEKALKGYDGLAKVKIPLPKDVNFWLGGGYYSYKSSGITSKGPMASANLELLNSLLVHGSRFELGYEFRREDTFKTDTHYATARINIPLSPLSKEVSARGIDYQMTRMIERDEDVVSGTYSTGFTKTDMQGSHWVGSNAFAAFVDLNGNVLEQYLEAVVGALAQGFTGGDFYTIFANAPSDGIVNLLGESTSDIRAILSASKNANILQSEDTFNEDKLEEYLTEYFASALANATNTGGAAQKTLDDYGTGLETQLQALFADLSSGSAGFTLPDLSSRDTPDVGASINAIKGDADFTIEAYPNDLQLVIGGGDTGEIASTISASYQKMLSDYFGSFPSSDTLTAQLSDIELFLTQACAHAVNKAMAADALYNHMNSLGSFPIAGTHLESTSSSVDAVSTELGATVDEALDQLIGFHFEGINTSENAINSLNFLRPVSTSQDLILSNYDTLTAIDYTSLGIPHHTFTSWVNMNGLLQAAITNLSSDMVGDNGITVAIVGSNFVDSLKMTTHDVTNGTEETQNLSSAELTANIEGEVLNWKTFDDFIAHAKDVTFVDQTTNISTLGASPDIKLHAISDQVSFSDVLSVSGDQSMGVSSLDAIFTHDDVYTAYNSHQDYFVDLADFQDSETYIEYLYGKKIVSATSSRITWLPKGTETPTWGDGNPVFYPLSGRTVCTFIGTDRHGGVEDIDGATYYDRQCTSYKVLTDIVNPTLTPLSVSDGLLMRMDPVLNYDQVSGSRVTEKNMTGQSNLQSNGTRSFIAEFND